MRGFKNLGAAFTGLIFLVAIAGCGGGGSASTGGGGGTGGGVSSPANSVYVTQTTSIVTPASASSNVLQFPRSDTGSVAPTATITGPPGIQFGFLTIDHNSSLYVAGTIYSSTCNSPTSGALRSWSSHQALLDKQLPRGPSRAGPPNFSHCAPMLSPESMWTAAITYTHPRASSLGRDLPALFTRGLRSFPPQLTAMSPLRNRLLGHRPQL
jgi:hypothetical protein